MELNRYNLEVLASVANICRHNLHLLQELAGLDKLMTSAAQEAAAGHADRAVTALDKVLDGVETIRRERNDVLKSVTATWQKTWLPRVAEANGRKFVHELDDVKDHLPDRTIDMQYLVYRELNLPLGQWFDKLQAVRNHYAKAHQLTERNERCDWSSSD